MLNAGIIGIFGYAGSYLPHLARLEKEGRLKLAAAVVRDPARDTMGRIASLKERGVRIFSTQEEMYRNFRPDIVFIPTGIAFHEPMTIAALNRGCSVMMEKPASGTSASVENMMKAEKKQNGVFAAVGFQHIYDRTIQKFKRLMLNGTLGRPLAIRTRGAWPRDDSYYRRNDWAGRAVSHGQTIFDSPANNAFAHYLNAALFLCGKEFPVSSEGKILNARLWRARKDIETFDSCFIEILSETGTRIEAFFTHTPRIAEDPSFDIKCEKGRILWRQNAGWKILSSAGTVLDSGEYRDPAAQMFDDIVEKLENRESFCCSLAIARAHTRCIEALHRGFEVVDAPDALVSIDSQTGRHVFVPEGFPHA